MEDIFSKFLSYVLIITLFCFLFSTISYLYYESDINSYNTENTVLVDNFITYSKFGSPNYYLVIKFDDNKIKQFNVNADEYYNYLNK